MLLCERHTAGGNTGNLFELSFALSVAAPHRFDEAGFFVGKLNQLVQIQSGIGAVFTVV